MKLHHTYRSNSCIYNVRGRQLGVVLLIISVLLFGLNSTAPARATEDTSQFFSQANHTVSGKFLAYWRTNGGLATYGFPITDARDEVDPETGKTFLTQWFERNRFELHLENAGTKYEVLLGLLGKDLRREALAVDPDFIKGNVIDLPPPQKEQIFFSETGHYLRADFLDYWTKNGGLERFGYPISDEHPEVDPETGKAFLMQWFERARFEQHPENKAPFNILLGLLGNQLKIHKGIANHKFKLGAGYNTLREPYATAVDRQGNVYVLDADDQVKKFDGSGRLITKWGSHGRDDGQFIGLVAITVDGQGQVYVTDRGNNRVQVFDSQGRFLTKWGGLGAGIGQFYIPSGIAVDGQHQVYIIGHHPGPCRPIWLNSGPGYQISVIGE